MTHEACESKLRSVVRSSMHPYQANWVASGVRSFIIPCLQANLMSALKSSENFEDHLNPTISMLVLIEKLY